MARSTTVKGISILVFVSLDDEQWKLKIIKDKGVQRYWKFLCNLLEARSTKINAIEYNMQYNPRWPLTTVVIFFLSCQGMFQVTSNFEKMDVVLWNHKRAYAWLVYKSSPV